MPYNISDVEEAYFAFVLGISEYPGQLLLDQFRNASVVSKTVFPRGFAVDYNYAGSIKLPNLELTDIVLEVEGLQYGLGTRLVVEGGKISELEGYTFEENLTWPVKILGVRRA